MSLGLAVSAGVSASPDVSVAISNGASVGIGVSVSISISISISIRIKISISISVDSGQRHRQQIGSRVAERGLRHGRWEGRRRGMENDAGERHGGLWSSCSDSLNRIESRSRSS